jgi:hypothetical protein
MHARLAFILRRINADLSGVGLGSVHVADDPGPGWGEDLTVFDFRGHLTSANPEHVEEAVALLAYTFQDDVIDERHGAWPEVNGRPLFPSADSGVACWCLDGKPWCAVGQLADALASARDGAGTGSAG